MRTRKSPNTSIRTRLLELLAERNLTRVREGQPMLTLRDVAKETAISYTALFMFAHNKGKTISFDAMAALMAYFNLTSFDRLFTFIPKRSHNGVTAEHGEENDGDTDGNS